jgi:hypothetical protein
METRANAGNLSKTRKMQPDSKLQRANFKANKLQVAIAVTFLLKEIG